MNDLLFSNFKLGPIQLKNRIVMSPMTRSRAIGNIPNALMATYYGQRTEAGLIVTEGVSPSPNGLGYARIPGAFSAEQAQGWRAIASAVHTGGSRIFMQLMHTGRITHADNLPSGAQVLAPSAITAPGQMWTDAKGMLPHSTPAAMTETQIEATIEEFVHASRLAVEAGLDGVELHGANGYLIDQFLNTSANQRTDKWGGSPQNRVRFAVEVAKRIARAIGSKKVGIRISPYGTFNGMAPDPAMDEVYTILAQELNALDIAYIHVIMHNVQGSQVTPAPLHRKIRESFQGALILAGAYDRTRAEADLQEKKGDLIAFGRPFLSNPRLVIKLKNNEPLLPPDPNTFYSPGEKGYTDY